MAGQLMISCRLATELIEKKHRTRLSWWESMQLPLHIALCEACRQYQVQSGVLEKLFKARLHEDASDLASVSDEKADRLEQQILKKIEEQEGAS